MMRRVDAKYFFEWKKVCAVKGWRTGDNQLRHAVTKLALAIDKSHKDFSPPDWDRIFTVLRTLKSTCNLDALMLQVAYEQHDAAQAAHVPRRAAKPRTTPTRYERLTGVNDPGERKRLLWFVGRLFEPDYVAAIAREPLFDTNDFSSLPIPDLMRLRDELKRRFSKWLTRLKNGAMEMPDDWFLRGLIHAPNPATGRANSNAEIIIQLLHRGHPVRMTRAIVFEEPF